MKIVDLCALFTSERRKYRRSVLQIHSLLRPNRNVCQGGSAIKEVEDDDRHDDGDTGDGHNRSQIDS